MWEMYQQNQSELQVLMNEEERLVRRMESLKQEILDYSGKRNNLERQVTKEQQDVVKLEGFSFANMVRNWRGNLDEIRDQEKAEAAEKQAAAAQEKAKAAQEKAKAAEKQAQAQEEKAEQTAAK